MNWAKTKDDHSQIVKCNAQASLRFSISTLFTNRIERHVFEIVHSHVHLLPCIPLSTTQVFFDIKLCFCVSANKPWLGLNRGHTLF